MEPCSQTAFIVINIDMTSTYRIDSNNVILFVIRENGWAYKGHMGVSRQKVYPLKTRGIALKRHSGIRHGTEAGRYIPTGATY